MFTEPDDILIAHVMEVSSSSMTAKIIEKHLSETALVTIDKEELLVGHIGSYVAIRQADIHILAIVYKIWQTDRYDANNICVPERFIALACVGDILRDGTFVRGIHNYPTPGAEVCAVGFNEINAVFAKFRHNQYFIGHLSSHENYDLAIDPQAFFSRHFAIVGQSGAGKSWTVTSLIQRAVQAMPKSHIILLDLHGEYCWKNEAGIKQSAFLSSTVNNIEAQEIEMPYWMMSYAELIDLFIDRTDKGASMQMSYLSEVLQQLKREEARRLGLSTFSIDTPIYFSLAQMYKLFKAANEEKKDFGKVQGALYGQFDEFLIKMQTRLNDVRYDFLLKPKIRKTSESMVDLLRQFMGLGSKKANITVVDLSSVPADIRPAISAQVGKIVYEFNYWNPNRRDFPITLICEEAHIYIPREKGGQFEGSKKMMERIAKEGRKYGVSIGVISQRPIELSETMLAQCSSFVCLRTTNPEDQSYIRSLIPESEGNLANVLASLGRGEALVLGESVPLPTRVQIYKPSPAPKSNDVDYATGWREGPDDLNVEEIVKLWRSQTRK